MTSMFVISAEQGAYDDYTLTPILVAHDRKTAELKAKELESRDRTIKSLASQFQKIIEDQFPRDEILNMKKYDPGLKPKGSNNFSREEWIEFNRKLAAWKQTAQALKSQYQQDLAAYHTQIFEYFMNIIVPKFNLAHEEIEYFVQDGKIKTHFYYTFPDCYIITEVKTI